MKCIKCGGKACFEIRRHRAAFCYEHLVEHIHTQIQRAVSKNKMFTKNDRILVAVSGGKDSLALWDALLDLGYEADGLYIDLGIDDYSEKSGEKVKQFVEKRRVHLRLISLKDLYDVGVKHISRKTPKSTCSVCGLVKRYVMNLAAHKCGYDAVATGHNLDDEAAVLLGNVLHWQTGYLRRQSPLMPSRDGLACKVKPLCRIGERETAAYCVTKGIDYIKEECPMSEGASTFIYKEVLNGLEFNSPGTKDQFYLGFLRHGRSYFYSSAEQSELHNCSECGQPTTAEVCSFCRQMAKVDLDPLEIHREIEAG